MNRRIETAPLRERHSSADARLRVLLLTNEENEGDHPGHRDAFARLERQGLLESFTWSLPKLIARSKGAEGTLRELLQVIRATRPTVIVKFSPGGIRYTKEWFHCVATADPRPLLMLWEGDAWDRWAKPIQPEMQLWWKAADIVFTVAVGRQRKLIEGHGGREVRFIPFTYDHIRYQTEEANEPQPHDANHEVAVIGNFWGNRYFVSRLPGARQRLRLVRGLQKDPLIPVAVYGRNWTGRGVKGPIPIAAQAAVARGALVTANWDHFPNHAAFYSDRLAVALLAGRAHVTTLHPSSEWLPGQDSGLFLEPSVDAAIRRVRELLARPREEVLELGLAGHRWVRNRLSDREMALYMLGHVDERLLRQLPLDPWSRLPY